MQINNNMILYILLILVIFYIAKRYFDDGKRVNQLALLQLQLTTPIDPNIMNILDDFIETIFNDYILSKSDYLNKDYISEQDEVNIRKEVIDEVGKKISPFLYQKIAIYYNENAISDVIATRVFHYVTAFVIERNKIKQS